MWISKTLFTCQNFPNNKPKRQCHGLPSLFGQCRFVSHLEEVVNGFSSFLTHEYNVEKWLGILEKKWDLDKSMVNVYTVGAN